MSEEENFILMDGAMVLDALNSSRLFTAPDTPWLHPVFAHEDLRLAGPLLVAYTRVPEDGPEWKEIGRINNAFAHQLHFSIVRTGLPMQALAAHLRGFACFTDGAGDTYGLRIGDSRVASYLQGVLTSGQWNALTAPMACWQIKNRSGETVDLELSETRLQSGAGELRQLSLSDEQIDQLMQASEPDGLLAQIGKEPTLDSAQYTQSRYETASSCIRIWKAGGSSDRGLLCDFARRVFELGTAHRNDDEWMRQRLQEVSESDEKGSA